MKTIKISFRDKILREVEIPDLSLPWCRYMDPDTGQTYFWTISEKNDDLEQWMYRDENSRKYFKFYDLGNKILISSEISIIGIEGIEEVSKDKLNLLSRAEDIVIIRTHRKTKIDSVVRVKSICCPDLVYYSKLFFDWTYKKSPTLTFRSGFCEIDHLVRCNESDTNTFFMHGEKGLSIWANACSMILGDLRYDKNLVTGKTDWCVDSDLDWFEEKMADSFTYKILSRNNEMDIKVEVSEDEDDNFDYFYKSITMFLSQFSDEKA